MRTVLDTTDKKHVGEKIDADTNPIVFADGETLVVSFRLHNGAVVGNSNYVVFLSSPEE